MTCLESTLSVAELAILSATSLAVVSMSAVVVSFADTVSRCVSAGGATGFGTKTRGLGLRSTGAVGGCCCTGLSNWATVCSVEKANNIISRMNLNRGCYGGKNIRD